MAKNRNQSTPMEQKTETPVTATVTDPQLASASLEAAAAPENPEFTGSGETPAPAEEKLVDIVETDDQRQVREFMEKVVAARQAREKAEQPVPPPPMTVRQRTQIEEEQAAGRRALERHAEQAKLRPPPEREKGAGSSNPVFRPADYVPNMAQGNVGARDVKPRE